MDKGCKTSLLSLLPPFCIVAPIRELANNTFSILSNVSSYTTLTQIHSNMNIDNIDMCQDQEK